MRPIALAIATAACLCLLSSGCATSKPTAMHFANRQVVVLDADDVVRVMLSAGFDEEQILDLGTELRNGLAMHGATQIRAGNKVRAVFAVQEGCVHVSTMSRGSFVYDVEKKAVLH